MSCIQHSSINILTTILLLAKTPIAYKVLLLKNSNNNAVNFNVMRVLIVSLQKASIINTIRNQ